MATNTSLLLIADRAGAVMRRLVRDTAGNTLIIVAAALIPLLAIIGGGVDMGRSYLSQSRLQQACDAGVLATRKRIGSDVPTGGTIPAEAEAVGKRFFNINFRDGAYGTEKRSFAMTLESDLAVSGVAKVEVPTTVMQIFGHDDVPLTVNCQAKLNFSNTDIMMVLDTTGSMQAVNSGDTMSRIEGLKQVVKSFHGKIEAAKAPGTRMRYGFVPYAQSVNVGFLLKPDWMVDTWTYNGRYQHDTGQTQTLTNYDQNYTYISGTVEMLAQFTAATCPDDTMTWTVTNYTELPDGTMIWRFLENGITYHCTFNNDSGTFEVTPWSRKDHLYDWTSTPIGTVTQKIYDWKYDSYPFDVRLVKDTASNTIIPATFNVKMDGSPNNPTEIAASFNGCIEERDTYEITDYANVDLSRAIDLDIDRVPTPGDPATQWRPMFEGISWARKDPVTNAYSKPAVITDVGQPYAWSYCSAPAQKLKEMTAGDIDTYLSTLTPSGNTYHDIGMIWGGRLLSPTGIFASENADAGGQPTSRHLIFMTDGYTVPYSSFYTSYGIDPVDQRRSSPSSTMTPTQMVEARFLFACQEVKKRNITIWVVSFGVDLNPVLTQCAGPGKAFAAKNTAQLADTFSKIAASIGDLRVSK